MFRKKITILIALLLGLAVFMGLTWGGYDDPDTGKMLKGPMLDSLLKGSVEVDLEVPSAANRKEYEQLVAKIIKKWASIPASIIRKEQRIEEFSDIYAKFSRGVKVIFKQDAPLKVKFFDDMEKFYDFCASDGCYSYHDNAVYMPLKEIFEEESHSDFELVLTHEFGHALGLADQYYDALYEDRDVSWTHSSPNTNDESVMSGGSSDIGCDDVDGLIYEIDQYYTTPQTEKRPRWVSFCDDNIYAPNKYNERKQETRFQISSRTNNKGELEWIIWKDEQNGRKKTRRLTLNKNSNFTAWRKVVENAAQLPGPIEKRNYQFNAAGPNKEKVEIYNMFDNTWCFAFLNDELVWVDFYKRNSKRKGKRTGISRKLYFGGKGAITEIRWGLHSNYTLSTMSYFEHVSKEDDENLDAIVFCKPSFETNTTRCIPDEIAFDTMNKNSVWFNTNISSFPKKTAACVDIACEVEQSLENSLEDEQENILKIYLERLANESFEAAKKFDR